MKFERFSVIYKENCNNSETIECCSALRRPLKTFFAVVQMKMLAFSLFYDAAKTAKKRLKQFYKHGRRN